MQKSSGKIVSGVLEADKSCCALVITNGWWCGVTPAFERGEERRGQ